MAYFAQQPKSGGFHRQARGTQFPGEFAFMEGGVRCGAF